jgi:low temperature requirement protein LtrA
MTPNRALDMYYGPVGSHLVSMTVREEHRIKYLYTYIHLLISIRVALVPTNDHLYILSSNYLLAHVRE